jgi:propanol-preferring alcohol dehydrogenase
LHAAKSIGADIVINSKTEEATKPVMEVTGRMGADKGMDFVNTSKTVETDMQLRRRRTKVVLVRLFSGEL